MLSKLGIILITVILLIGYSIVKKQNNRNMEKIFIIVSSAILALIFSLRELFLPDTIGYDYIEYKRWFYSITFLNLPHTYNNIGFNLLIAICRLFTSNYVVFFFICSFIINILFLKYIEYNSKDYNFSFIIYILLFYLLTFNVIRQWMACAIFVYSIKYIIEKKYIKYIISIIIASSFHSSALILLLAYPLFNIKNSTKRKEIYTILIGIIGFFIFNDIVTVLLNISKRLGFEYMTKYNNIASDFGIKNFTDVIITLTTYILISLVKKEITNDNYQIEKIHKYYLLLAVIFALLATKNLILARICIYFTPAIIITIPKISNIFKGKSKMIFKIFVILIFMYSFLT